MRFSARDRHQVVAHNDRLWVIGGYDGAFKNDVWWSADDGKTWNKVEKAAGSMRFSARSSPQVVAHNDRLWVIGGWSGGSYKNDVWWSKDGVTWTEATNNAGFSPREAHQVVTYNNRLWVIGGQTDDSYKNDVWWSRDGVTWTEVSPEARGIEHFSARNSHQVVVHDDKLWLIGGWDGGNKNDVWWSRDGVTWTEVKHTGTRFSARSNHQVVVYDGKLWLIGGWDGALKDDVWRSQDGGKNWSKVEPTDTSKPRFAPQNNHQVAVYDGKLWLIGDWDRAHKTNIWRSQDGADWTKVEPTDNSTPWPRSNTHQLVAHNNRLWVFGGSRDILNVADFSNAVWSSENGVTWTEVKATDPRFSGRQNHQVVVHNNQLWVIGGFDGAQKGDVWRSEDGENWRLGFHRVFQFR